MKKLSLFLAGLFVGLLLGVLLVGPQYVPEAHALTLPGPRMPEPTSSVCCTACTQRLAKLDQRLFAEQIRAQKAESELRHEMRVNDDRHNLAFDRQDRINRYFSRCIRSLAVATRSIRASLRRAWVSITQCVSAILRLGGEVV